MVVNSKKDSGTIVPLMSDMLPTTLLRVYCVTRKMSLRVLYKVFGERSNLKLSVKCLTMDCFAPFYSCHPYSCEWQVACNDKNYLCNTPLKLGILKNSSISGFSHALFKQTLYLVLFLASFNFFSCGNTPEPINYGKDECEHCRMMIADNKYGAEAVTDKGKIFKFDSIECLIEFALEKNIIGDAKQVFFVTDFSKPEELIDARTAVYVHNENFRSPMGLNVSAFGSESKLNSFLSSNGGKKLSWVEVIELVKQSIM